MAARGWKGAALRGVRLPAAGAESLRGQKPFLFLRKKKRFLTPKKKLGPVYGKYLVDHGGVHLYALFGDQPRPLRPFHWGTGRSYGSIQRPTGCSTLVAECGGGVPGASHLTTPVLRETPAGGGWIERKPVSVPKRQAVTAGKGPLCHTKAAGRRFRP